MVADRGRGVDRSAATDHREEAAVVQLQVEGLHYEGRTLKLFFFKNKHFNISIKYLLRHVNYEGMKKF